MAKDTLLCKFTSKVNTIAKDIIYELHDWNDDYYVIKWMIGNNKHTKKDKKSIVDNMLKCGEYIAQAN